MRPVRMLINFWRVCIKHPYIHHIRFTITFMWFYYESKFHFYGTCFCAYRDRYMGATIYDRLFILSVIISLMLHTDHCLESSRQIIYQFMTIWRCAIQNGFDHNGLKSLFVIVIIIVVFFIIIVIIFSRTVW